MLALALATAAAVTPDELGDHRRADDCWIAVHGEVYDVTGFVAAHPGGPVLTAFCGADGTTAFEARPGTGEPHSPDARAILDGMHVGALEGEAKPATAGAWRVLDPMRARTGVVAPTATILGHDQLHFGFAHHFHFPDSPRTNARVELGWGFANVADLVVAHSTWSGESGAQVRVAILQQEGRRRIRSLERRGPAPLSLVTQLSAGYRVAEAIEDAERFVATGQIVAERTFGPASIAIAPGVRYADTVTPYGTALLDLKPHPTGGMFAEVVVSPLGQRIRTRFAAGLRAYTRAHAFTIWGGTSPSLAPGEAASPIGGAGFGFSMERRFPFP